MYNPDKLATQGTQDEEKHDNTPTDVNKHKKTLTSQ
jgi:hypothetical protein